MSPTARFSQQLEKWAAGNSSMKLLKKAGHGRASSVACFDILRLFVGIVIEVALNIDDRGTLVARAAGQVAQRADEVRQVPGGRTLGHHVAHQTDGGILFPDLLCHRLLQRLAGQVDMT